MSKFRRRAEAVSDKAGVPERWGRRCCSAHFIESSHDLFFGGTTCDAELFFRRAIAQSPGRAEAQTYSPADALHDGWHDLRGRLKNREGDVPARAGYFSGPAVMRRR